MATKSTIDTPLYINPTQGINLDRVAFDEKNPNTVLTTRQITPAVQEYTQKTVSGGNSYSLDWTQGLRTKKLLSTAAFFGSLVLGNLAINTVTEKEKKSPSLQNTSSALKQDMSNIGVRTKTDLIKNICENVDWHFEHRFFTKDAQGNKSFNWGALLVPFQFVSTEGCHVNGALKLDVDAIFAPTFSELATSNSRAQELRTALKKYIQTALQDQLIVYGIPNTTDSLGVYNKKNNVLTITPNGTVDVSLPISHTTFSNVIKTGSASTESAIGLNALGKSIQGKNLENETLAKNRLTFISPIFDDALRSIGADPSVLQGAQKISLEANLTISEVNSMASIVRNAFPGAYTSTFTDDDVIMDFVEKANKTDAVTMQTMQGNKKLADLYRELFVEKRSMSLSTNIDQNQKTTTIHPISIALPLFLLWLIPGIRKTPKPDKVINELVRDIPAKNQVTAHNTYRPIARRIFDSNQVVPGKVSKKKENLSFDRLFDEYEDIFSTIDDHGEKYRQTYSLFNKATDRHIMLQHFLSDEVGPDMIGDDEFKEPLIDYMSVIMNNLNRYRSERNKELTVDDMIRKMSWDLVNMWQDHDEQANPMKVGPEPGQGETMSLSGKLDYRHSSYVVAYARLLAEEFANIVSESEEANKGKITEEAIQKTLELKTLHATGGYKDAQHNPIKGTSGNRNRTLGFATTELQAPGANTGAIL